MENKIKEFVKTNNFINLAKYIMFNTHIKTIKDSYRIIELELYIYNTAHPDIFTHKNCLQKKSMVWYFHQLSDKEHSYKGGNYKGLDIGCGFDGGYAGILIRSIMNESTNTVIEGPCNTVNELLKSIGVDSILTLVTTKFNNNLTCLNHDILKLVEKKFTQNLDIYSAPRIGLTLKGNNIEQKKKYIDKKYRFIIFKDKIKKEKTKMEKI